MRLAPNVLMVEYRRKLGLTQAQLAEKIGVSRALVALWEQLRAPLTPPHLAAATAVLGLPATLQAGSAARGLDDVDTRLADSEVRAIWRPHEPPVGTLPMVFELSEHAQPLYRQARQFLTPQDVLELVHVYPRDSAMELLCMFAIIACCAYLRYLTLSRFACPIHVMDAVSRAANAHVKRPAIVLPWEDAILIFFPQVPMAVWGEEHRSRRLDFLVYYVEPGPRRRSLWSALEIDDPTHPRRAEDDTIRDGSIWIPTLRRQLRHIVRPDLAAGIVAEIRGLIKRFGSHEKRQFTHRRKTEQLWQEQRAERQAQAG
jgi:transcriptional regulator with XRE-family HTH domain